MQKDIRIALLGSTGSIGRNSIEVVKNLQKNGFQAYIKYLTANSNYELLYSQIIELEPESAVICTKEGYDILKERLKEHKTELIFGDEGIYEIAKHGSYDLLINAMVGFSGLKPTVYAIKKGVNIATANKESLVIAGRLITDLCRETGSHIIPIDSEHSAILQCIQGESFSSIKRLILTASGGPFLNTPKEEFRELKAEQALKHPIWKMGSKITIDSATLMNKGFEIIEGRWLFNIDVDRINIVIHPQSVIHSLVEFVDSSVKAQLGIPDMKIPIQYAITFPVRINADFPKLNISEFGSLTFFEPDAEKFECIKLAYDASRMGGLYPTILNAANEEAVELFLNGRIRFTDIPVIIKNALDTFKPSSSDDDLESIINTDKWTRDHIRSGHLILN